jgi:steroid delta-isomerase-like uncharacterized protein
MTSETIHQELASAWNARDFDRMRSLLGEGYTYTGPDGREQPGPEAALAVARLFASAFPDATLEVVRVYVSGNVAVAEMIGRGTHEGDFLGIAPTRRKATMAVCNIIELRDDKAYREREYFDLAGMYAQLGVNTLPAMHAAV